jgi:hypothetical protein
MTATSWFSALSDINDGKAAVCKILIQALLSSTKNMPIYFHLKMKNSRSAPLL